MYPQYDLDLWQKYNHFFLLVGPSHNKFRKNHSLVDGVITNTERQNIQANITRTKTSTDVLTINLYMLQLLPSSCIIPSN